MTPSQCSFPRTVYSLHPDRVNVSTPFLKAADMGNPFALRTLARLPCMVDPPELGAAAPGFVPKLMKFAMSSESAAESFAVVVEEPSRRSWGETDNPRVHKYSSLLLHTSSVIFKHRLIIPATIRFAMALHLSLTNSLSSSSTASHPATIRGNMCTMIVLESSGVVARYTSIF